MRERALIEIALRLLFLIPEDDTLERGEALEALYAWHDIRYEAFNAAEQTLWQAELIMRVHHGQGVTYHLTVKGADTREAILALLYL